MNYAAAEIIAAFFLAKINTEKRLSVIMNEKQKGEKSLRIETMARVMPRKFTIIDVAVEEGNMTSIAMIQSDEIDGFSVDEWIKRETGAWMVSRQRIFTSVGEFIAYFNAFAEIEGEQSFVGKRTLPFLFPDNEEVFSFLDRVWLVPVVKEQTAYVPSEKFSLLSKTIAASLDEARKAVIDGKGNSYIPMAYSRLPLQKIGEVKGFAPSAERFLSEVLPYSALLRRIMCKMVILSSMYYDNITDGIADPPIRDSVDVEEGRRVVSPEELQNIFCVVRSSVFCIHCLFARLTAANLGGQADFYKLMNFGTAVDALKYGIDGDESAYLIRKGLVVADLVDAFSQYSCIMSGYKEFCVDDNSSVITGNDNVFSHERTAEMVGHIHGMALELLAFDRKTDGLFYVSDRFLSDVRPDFRDS